jgi:hypothetical protein
VRLPTDPQERSVLVFKGIAGKDAQDFPKYYVLYADLVLDVIHRAERVNQLLTRYPVRQTPCAS